MFHTGKYVQPEAVSAPGTDSPDDSVLNPGQAPEIKGVTRYAIKVILHTLLMLFILIIL